MPDPGGESAILRTIDAIYAAAAAPDRWMAVLEHLQDMFHLSFAAFVTSNADRSKVEGIAAGVDADDYQAFLATFYRGSVFFKDAVPWFPGQIVHSQQLVPPRIFHRTRMYQEFWRPHGLEHGLRLAVARNAGGIQHAINIVRPPSAEAFDAPELCLAQALMPHLQRAIELNLRLRHADLLASAALATLDTLRHAVLLLDQDCRVLHANALAQAVLRAADGLTLTARDGMPQAATPVVTARLHAVLAGAAGRNGAPARSGSLRLPRPGGDRAFAVLAIPFRQEAHWSLPRRPAVLMCITDPDAATTASRGLMIELFGLTGVEAALAADLLTGRDLRGIAQERGRSINTVRSQLAGLMAKTGVNRQSELMRLLGSLPRGVGQSDKAG